MIPFGPTIELFGRQIRLVILNLDGGLLFALAASSLGVYGIVCAGWSSRNKYSLMGGLRSSAQMISYELALGLSLIGVLLVSGHAAAGRDRRAAGRLVLELERLRRLAAAGLPDLPDRRLRRDQPAALRPARGRERAGRRLPHRVLVDEVRHVLHGRVRGHDHHRRRWP